MAQWIEHHSHDVDDQAKALNGWQQSYEQLGCGRFQGSAWQYVTDDGVLLRERTNRQLREQIVPPPGHVVMAVPMSVAPGSTFGGRPLTTNSLMMLSAHDEYEVVAAGELDLVGVLAPRDVFNAQLSPRQAEWFDRAHPERNRSLPAPVADSIRAMLLGMLGRAEHEGQTADKPDGSDEDLLSAALVRTLSLAMAGNDHAPASNVPRRAETRMRVVRRAVEFMRANLHNDVGIPEICSAACASRRNLQYCFEELLRTTPQAHLRALRLNEARRSLKLGAERPITQLAETLGFSSPSHFTRHYKVMFDELPSETHRRSTAAPPEPAASRVVAQSPRIPPESIAVAQS